MSFENWRESDCDLNLDILKHLVLTTWFISYKKTMLH
jgi:hypothetical protein